MGGVSPWGRCMIRIKYSFSYYSKGGLCTQPASVPPWPLAQVHLASKTSFHALHGSGAIVSCYLLSSFIVVCARWRCRRSNFYDCFKHCGLSRRQVTQMDLLGSAGTDDDWTCDHSEWASSTARPRRGMIFRSPLNGRAGRWIQSSTGR